MGRYGIARVSEGRRGVRHAAVALAGVVGCGLAVEASAQSGGDKAQPPQGKPGHGGAAKVTVVVAGDPTDDLRAAAARMGRVLQGAPGLRTPAAHAMRAALRGEPPDGAEDGLQAARAARRKLGWSEARDLPALAAIGRRTGAVAIVEVRRREGHLEAVVADVGARAFYEGAIRVAGAADAELVAFVRTRAEAAAQRVVAGSTRKAPKGTRGPAPRRAATETGPPGARGPSKAGNEARDGDGDADGADAESERSPFVAWLADNWAYLAAGVALAGVTTFFIVRGTNGDDQPQPVLRFTSGGGR